MFRLAIGRRVSPKKWKCTHIRRDRRPEMDAIYLWMRKSYTAKNALILSKRPIIKPWDRFLLIFNDA